MIIGTIELANSLKHAQIVREIRNSVRQYMTRHTDFITPEQQEKWFYSYIDDIDQELYLYYDIHNCCVGYGYVKKMNSKYWGSLAVKQEFQGRGFGTQIYKDMINQTSELWIEIYTHNQESISAAVEAGFQLVDVQDKVVIMKGAYDTTI